MGTESSGHTPPSPGPAPQLALRRNSEHASSSSTVSVPPHVSQEPVSVTLNVYDTSAWNRYMYWCGMGMFHSAVEVHGMQYAFALHGHSDTGIYDAPPMYCPPRFKIRRSIPMGNAVISPLELENLIREMDSDYAGNSYDLITRNCNHFSDDLCHRLTGKHIPGWVNRLARIGSLCVCCLPAHLRFPLVPFGGYHSSDNVSETLSIPIPTELTEAERGHAGIPGNVFPSPPRVKRGPRSIPIPTELTEAERGHAGIRGDLFPSPARVKRGPRSI